MSTQLPPDNENPRKERPDALAELIARAGARMQAPAAMEAGVRAAAYEAWLQSVRRRRLRRSFGWFAAAAVALIGIGLAWRLSFRESSVTPSLVASLAYSRGEVSINSKDAQLSTPLYSRDELRTGADGGARLSLSNAGTLRLAGNTHVRWHAAEQLELLEGAIYMDSGPRHATLYITTKYGTVSHLGTRYQVRMTPEALNVSVREGTVEVIRAGDKVSVRAQQALRVDRQGRVTRSNSPTYGDAWTWADALATGFEIENRTLDEFLRWTAAETGRTLEYADAATERAAMQTVLHGASGSFTPAQRLAAVLPTTDFVARYDQERLIISRR